MHPLFRFIGLAGLSPHGERHSVGIVQHRHLVALGESGRRDQDFGAEAKRLFYRGRYVFDRHEELDEVRGLRRGGPDAALYALRRAGVDLAVTQ